MATPVFNTKEEMVEYMKRTRPSFCVMCLTQWGLSHAYAAIVAERILEPGAQLLPSDALWLAKFEAAEGSFARMAQP